MILNSQGEFLEPGVPQEPGIVINPDRFVPRRGRPKNSAWKKPGSVNSKGVISLFVKRTMCASCLFGEHICDHDCSCVCKEDERNCYTKLNY